MKKAIITGVSGQDGHYLARMLLESGYYILGLTRNITQDLKSKFIDFEQKIEFCECNLDDEKSIASIIKQSEADEFYNLAAQSISAISFEKQSETAKINGVAVIYMLEAIRNYSPQTRFFQASSSEIFGRNPVDIPQNESTALNPETPYAIAKVFAQQMVKSYREYHGLFACSGILYNHESDLRSDTFITKKIASGVAKIAPGEDYILETGNIQARRDGGHTIDFVKAMHMILQQPKPDDYILATGILHSVRDLIEIAFDSIFVKIRWIQSDGELIGIDDKTERLLVQVNKKFIRDNDNGAIQGDIKKAKTNLLWEPTIDFNEMVKSMVANELNKGKYS